MTRESEFQWYVPGCTKGQQRYILKCELVNKVFVHVSASLTDRSAVGFSSSLHLLLSQNTLTIPFLKLFQHFFVEATFGLKIFWGQHY